MSYEKELLEEAIYQCGKLTPNEEDRLYKWIKSAEDAKRKADEYEAKAIILDRVKEFSTEPPFLLANNEHEDYELYAYDQILRLIEKYESGGYDAKNDEVDYCAKCTVKPIVKEHMCDECYAEHCQWLRNQPQGIRIGDYLAKNHKFSKEDLEKVVESDQWYTIYESGNQRTSNTNL